MNNVTLTKRNIFIRWSNTGELYLFNPNTGLFFGVSREDSEQVFLYLNNQIDHLDEPYHRIFESNPCTNSNLLPSRECWGDVIYPEDPLLLNWLITRNCNNNCTYCYAFDLMEYERNNKRKEIEISDESELSEIINNILSYNPLAVVISGGEPTLHQNLQFIINNLVGKTGIIIDTNGSQLNTQLLEYLKSKNVLIRVSLDSLHHLTNNKIRKKKKEFKNCISDVESALYAINYCIEQSIPIIVQTVVTTTNFNDLYDMGYRLSVLGLKIWRLLKIVPVKKAIEEGNVPDKNNEVYINETLSNLQKSLYNKMKLMITENDNENALATILIDSEGVFLIESIEQKKKHVIDRVHPKKPSIKILWEMANRKFHYFKYLEVK